MSIIETAEIRVQSDRIVVVSLNMPDAPRRPDLAPGSQIAHYKVVEKIGQGGMGAVYKAIDTNLDRPVAIKVLAHGVGTKSHERRFAREAKAASALNHPNIVTIYEFNSNAGVDFLSMEYVPGATLLQLLERRERPLDVMLGYARQAARAIARAHQAGIVHRDLKPGNIMVTPDGLVKVLDFGLAKLQAPTSEEALTQTALTMTGTVVGTPAYMSPEQANGESEDWRTDIFSFGVILYEIVCGRRPFEGKNAHSVMYQITHVDPPSPSVLNPAVPREVAELIEKCIRKKRAERPQSMDELASTLAQWDRPPAGSPEAGEVGRSRMSRRVWLAGAAGAAAIGTAFWLSRAPERVISYSLQAQQYRGDEPVGEVYTASTADTFEGGWKFRLRVQPGQPGFLYLINDGPGDSGKNRLLVLYPAQQERQTTDNDGLSHRPSGANDEIVTGWYKFDSNPGTEKLWIVWADHMLEPIEQVLRGEIQEEVREPAQAARIQSLLARLRKPAESQASTPVPQSVQWRAAEGVLGSAIELRHR